MTDGPITYPVRRCTDCAHAEWVRTPTGRISSKYAGRCTYVPPPLPVMLHTKPRIHDDPTINRHIDWRPAVWPKYVGRCDMFKSKDPEP